MEGGDAVLHAFLPPAAQPGLIQHRDITRPWHPRSGTRKHRQHLEQQLGEQQAGQQLQGEQQAGQQLQREQQLPEPPPPPPPKLYFFGLWGSQVQDPQAWGLGPRPAHEFVVREATARTGASQDYQGGGQPGRPAGCGRRSGLIPQQISAAAFGRSRRDGKPALQLLVPRLARARGLVGSLVTPPGRSGWLRSSRVQFRCGTAADLRPRQRALHQCHREQMTLMMLLLLSQQAHQDLGPISGERCTLPIWTGGNA